jgi:hypothetical protein
MEPQQREPESDGGVKSSRVEEIRGKKQLERVLGLDFKLGCLARVVCVAHVVVKVLADLFQNDGPGAGCACRGRKKRKGKRN